MTSVLIVGRLWSILIVIVMKMTVNRALGIILVVLAVVTLFVAFYRFFTGGDPVTLALCSTIMSLSAGNILKGDS